MPRSKVKIFRVNLGLGEFQQSGLHIRKCRIVAKLGNNAQSLPIKDRKRYPDNPILSVEPESVAKNYGLHIAPDDCSPNEPAWALTLMKGPINGFALADLIEIAFAKAGDTIELEVQVSLRQFVSNKEERGGKAP